MNVQRSPIPTRLKLTAALAAACALASGCATRDRPRLSVLLIVVDSMRADHLGAYGYGRPTSPRLDAMARGGIAFTHATSQAPWTRPSVASLFTSTYISVHRVLFSMRVVDGQERSDALNENFLTLAEAMSAGGFATGGFGMKQHLNPEFGFGQGFDGYDMQLGRAEKINRRTLDWLRRADPERFFIYLHYNDPHYPYTPRPGFDSFGVAKPRVQINGATRKAFREGNLPLFPEDARDLVDLYDAEIRYTDHHIGKLVDTITARGYSNLLIVVTADHGEEFLEHGDITHGHSLYSELLHVPLIVSGSALPADSRGARRDTQVQVIDIMPTLLDLAGLPAPPGIQGVTFAGALSAGAASASGAAAFSERLEPEEPGFSETIVEGRWKLIRDLAGGRTMLFDLSADPGEQVRIEADRQEMVTRLLAQLDTWREANRALHDKIRPEETAPLDPEIREKLRSLGYIQ